MILKEWLKMKNIRPADFARDVKIAPSTLYRALGEKRRLSARYAVLIEVATKGQVSRTEALWPEL